MSPKEDDDLDVDIGGPPDAPTNLEIGGFEATSVTLKWKAPDKDGGAPIKEYLVRISSIFFIRPHIPAVNFMNINRANFLCEFLDKAKK